MASDELIVANIMYFILSGNILCSDQFVRKGPNTLWLYSQACMRLEDFEKQYALNTKKMEKGIPGVTSPT